MHWNNLSMGAILRLFYRLINILNICNLQRVIVQPKQFQFVKWKLTFAGQPCRGNDRTVSEQVGLPKLTLHLSTLMSRPSLTLGTAIHFLSSTWMHEILGSSIGFVTHFSIGYGSIRLTYRQGLNKIHLINIRVQPFSAEVQAPVLWSKHVAPL